MALTDSVTRPRFHARRHVKTSPFPSSCWAIIIVPVKIGESTLFSALFLLFEQTQVEHTIRVLRSTMVPKQNEANPLKILVTYQGRGCQDTLTTVGEQKRS